MYVVAAALLVLSGLFYSASHHEIGSFGVTMCTYGSAFCAALAGAWGMFVSIK
jgi:cytidine deaminase